jgi:hypothetical protein
VYGPNGFVRTLRGAGNCPLELAATIAPSGTQEMLWDLQLSHHWYDLIVSVGRHQWRLAGHVEDGHESVSDPAKLAPVLG